MVFVKRFFLLLTFLVGFSFSSVAQKTLRLRSEKLSHERAILLFENKNYSNAQRAFLTISTSENYSPNEKLNALYYSSLCALYLNQPESLSVKKLKLFSTENPNHPKADEALFNIASYYYSKKKFKEATDYYNLISLSEFDDDKKDQGRFEQAYSYFELKSYNQAEGLFDRVKNKTSKYSPAANYYSGYIKLKKENYDGALADFKSAEKNEAYSSAVPVMITNIYNKQGKYEELINYATPIVKARKSVTNKKEITGLVAEAHYSLGQHKQSLPFFKAFTKGKKASSSSTNFKYGKSAYLLSNYKTAVEQFKLIAGTEDSLAQASSFLLGNSYLKMNNKPYALNSFLVAGNSNFNENITSKSLYNAGKIQFDQKKYALALETFQTLRTKYPSFQESKEVSELLTESYLNSNNYDKALLFIESLPKPRTTRVNKVYQQVTYDKALKAFNSKDFKTCLNYLEKSLAYNFDKELKQEAFFWQAETYSRLNNWKKAKESYHNIAKSGADNKSEIYSKSLYGLGYAHFNTKEYKSAKSYFNRYINSGVVSNRSPYYASSLVRIGDCELVEKHWVIAREKFKEAIDLKTTQVAYAKYATGLTYFYDNQDDLALSFYKDVITNHKTSYHYAKSLFQYSYVNHINDNHLEAIKGFSSLIKDKPQSNILVETYLFRGRSYLINNQPLKALADFDLIINNFCSVSLNGKESIAIDAKAELSKLVEQEKITTIQYDKRLNTILECVPGLDVEYEKFNIAKGKRYNEKNYSGAVKDLNNFLATYPNSKYKMDAKFILGESYYLLNDLNQAKENFNFVFKNAPDTDYLATVDYLADIAKTENNLLEMVKYNKILVKNIENPEQILTAYLSLMQASFQLENYKESLTYSTEVLTREANLPHSTSEAKLFKGKSQYYLHDTINAKITLREKASESQDQYGAEALYYLAKIENENANYALSNKLIDELSSKFKSETYWINKSWLLLGSNYEKLDEQLQAISKYKLLVKYSSFLEIKNEAQTRLDRIAAEKEIEKQSLIKQDTLEIGE